MEQERDCLDCNHNSISLLTSSKIDTLGSYDQPLKFNKFQTMLFKF